MNQANLTPTHVGHGTWVPPQGGDFDNPGQFIFWVESSVPANGNAQRKTGFHPNHLASADRLNDFLSSGLLFRQPVVHILEPEPISFSVALPGTAKRPLPSIEMAQMCGELLPTDEEDLTWYPWEIIGLSVSQPLLFLKELHYSTSFDRPDLHLGDDLKFWIRYARLLSNLVSRHQFLPVMKCSQSDDRKGRLQIYSGWAPAAEQYEKGLRAYARAMPGICKLIYNDRIPKKRRAVQPECLSAIELLRHFSEQQLNQLVINAKFPRSVIKSFRGNWPQAAIDHPGQAPASAAQSEASMELTHDDWRKWRAWQQAIVGRSGHFSEEDGQEQSGFILGIRLHQIDETRDDALRVGFFVSANHDPSLQIDLDEWWNLSDADQSRWRKYFGGQFERNLLVDLGHAARMCPLLWQSMETSKPTGLDVSLGTAYRFLKNDALVLESAGFRVILPSWWTPKGRKRARLRINASARSSTSAGQASNKYFNLNSVIQFRYELSVGGEPVSAEEWQELAAAKSSLVRFRGEWMELNREQMNQMLELLQEQAAEQSFTTLSNMLKDISEDDEETTEYVFDEVLDDILRRLQQKETIQPLSEPNGFNGALRTYQKLGVSWLATMESLGLNPCLADDMGLGKTIQIIALLLHERAVAEDLGAPTPLTTLLIAPTSVLSNWQKEIQKFAPQLKSLIHHGSDRMTTTEELQRASDGQDILITSFSLARRDSHLLRQQEWGRIVVDEAQNIKNPRSAQAKSICALNANHRVALTGTPVENRLMDMWSLFNFLNPGFLGNQIQFRRAYELPIQRNSDRVKTRQLQKLTQPFILRRMKTDPAIISDLPEKMEQKVYCNLTTEQASLYQAVVDDVEKQMEEVEGMQRRGIILATLMKLKQICNHPAQFLQDDSPFTETRSHKLARLNEMVAEALEEMSSLLIFTQFTEVGTALERLMRDKHRCPVHYLHGGTNRRNRQRMMENFQDPDSPAGIFILSLKAGGTGITLTRANHVFHFDRWWNPAVENQATDRAYRIGQKKSVFVHKMVTVGTLEERIDAMIEDKQAMADSIVGTDENWLTEINDQQFRQLISLNRQSIMEAA